MTIEHTHLSLPQISKLGFGCEPLGGSDWGVVDVSQVGAAISIALEHGVNYFDTAAVYGLGVSEERLAKFLGDRRKDVIIGTKAGFSWSSVADSARAKTQVDCSPDVIKRNVHSSLKRLRIDTIPLLFVHYADPGVALEEVVEVLEKMRDQGKILAIGYSNHSIEMLKKLRQMHSFQAVQFEYNLLHRECEQNVLQFCKQYGLLTLCYGVLCRGILSAKFRQNTESFPASDRRSRLADFHGKRFAENIRLASKLESYAKKYSTSVAAIAIGWLLQCGGINSAIVGIKTQAQLKSNLEVLDLSLLDTDMKDISRIFDSTESGEDIATFV